MASLTSSGIAGSNPYPQWVGKRSAALAVIVLSTITLAACDVDGTAQRAPIDIDTGQYKTTKTTAETSSAAWIAGAQLGGYLPFLSEVDGRIVRATMGTSPLSSQKNLGGHIEGAENVPENQKFQFGFAVSGNDSNPIANSASSMTLKLGVFRYSDAEAARAAVSPTAEANRAGLLAERKKLGLEPQEISVEPSSAKFPAGSMTVATNAIVSDKAKGPAVSIKTLIPHGNDMLLIASWGLPASDAAATTERAYDLMLAKLSGSEAVSEQTSMTNADFVTWTVPFRKDESRSGFDGTAVGPRSYSQRYHNRTHAMSMFTVADVDLIATRETVVYRAGSNDKAKGLATAFDTWLRKDDSERPLTSPRDIPTAKCSESTDSSGDKSYRCAVVVDRYYATASSFTTLLDAQQKISAQYLILKERS